MGAAPSPRRGDSWDTPKSTKKQGHPRSAFRVVKTAVPTAPLSPQATASPVGAGAQTQYGKGRCAGSQGLCVLVLTASLQAAPSRWPFLLNLQRHHIVAELVPPLDSRAASALTACGQEGENFLLRQVHDSVMSECHQVHVRDEPRLQCMCDVARVDEELIQHVPTHPHGLPLSLTHTPSPHETQVFPFCSEIAMRHKACRLVLTWLTDTKDGYLWAAGRAGE